MLKLNQICAACFSKFVQGVENVSSYLEVKLWQIFHMSRFHLQNEQRVLLEGTFF